MDLCLSISEENTHQLSIAFAVTNEMKWNFSIQLIGILMFHTANVPKDAYKKHKAYVHKFLRNP